MKKRRHRWVQRFLVCGVVFVVLLMFLGLSSFLLHAAPERLVVRVLDAQAQPVQGMFITPRPVVTDPFRDRRVRLPAIVMTDSDGIWRNINPLAYGIYDLAVGPSFYGGDVYTCVWVLPFRTTDVVIQLK